MAGGKSGNYFTIENIIFSFDLKPGEFVVYAYLRRCSNVKTGQAWPSYQTIADAVNISRTSVARHVKALEEKGLLITEPTYWFDRSGSKMNGRRLFTLPPLSEVVENTIQRKIQEMEAHLERERVQKKLAGQKRT